MQIRVQGGIPLTGDYAPSGSTNAAAACLAAALLTDQPVTISNLPQTVTVQTLLDLSRWLGVQVAGGAMDAPLELIADNIIHRHLTSEHTGGLIGGILFTAPILARRGYVHIGLDFPITRIRTHIEALRDLGQEISIGSGGVEINAVKWDYKEILLSQASVTATGLMMMLATRLGRETIIRNAACEPHVQTLAHLLVGMGARIDGIGSNVLTVIGVPTLTGAHVTLPSDHIEAASAIAMIALTGGRGAVTGVNPHDLQMIGRVYQRLGLTLNLNLKQREVIVLNQPDSTPILHEEDADAAIESAPWPGFPSDLLPMATVMATQLRATTLIHERMFANRLLFVDKLKGMGAQIVLCDPHRAIVVGKTPLFKTYHDTPDARAGLALLAAALIAKGETIIDNAEALNGTFDGVFEKLKKMGAQIEVG
jgi:UDP-N-acetylglucosamine 1-carboxyvinyltransferase